MREAEYYEKQSQGISIFITVLGVVIAFFFGIGAMIGAMITMYAAVANRQREIGTLRALGFSRLQHHLLVPPRVDHPGAWSARRSGALASLVLGFVKFSMMNFQTWSEIVIAFEPNVDRASGSA